MVFSGKIYNRHLFPYGGILSMKMVYNEFAGHIHVAWVVLSKFPFEGVVHWLTRHLT